VGERGKDGKFLKGHKRIPGSGNLKGSKTKRTLLKQEILELLATGDESSGLPDRVTRLRAILKTQDSVLERFLFEQEFGKAKETLEVMGSVELSATILAARDRVKRAK